MSFHVATGHNFNIMAMQSLKIHAGFNCENDLGYKVSPQTIFHHQIPYEYLNFTFSQTSITTASSLKTRK